MPAEEIGRPKVGLGVMIFKDGKVLLGKRKNAHGAGQYAFPGGHMEGGESLEDCAKRETKEEAGIEIDNVTFLYFGNLRNLGGKHYAHIGVTARLVSGEPIVMEPEKCEGWAWYSLENPPSPLFGTIIHSIESYKTGRNFFED